MSTEETTKLTVDAPILIAIDFSEHSEGTLLWGLREARAHSCPFLILHVVHDPAAAPGSYRREGTGETLRGMETIAADMLESFLGKMGREHPEFDELKQPNSMLVSGLPGTRIVEVAEKVGARQIVVGSQGRTGIARLLLGSKAQQVAQLATIPVTIVKTKVAQ